MKRLFATLLAGLLALMLWPAAAYAASDGWRAEEGGWRYYENGAPLTSVNCIAGEGGRRYVFDEQGFLQTGDADGDAMRYGNLYYINPEHDPADPASCYAVTDYERRRSEGVTYYDSDGITFVGWMARKDGGRMYQTLIRGEDIGAAKDLYIYVWRAQRLPEGVDPVTGETVPAGLYLFGDDGVRVDEAGWHACGDGNMYLTDAGGHILEERTPEQESLDRSGLALIPKLDREEISALLAACPAFTPLDPFDVLPDCAAPYAPGRVSPQVLQAAADRLNAMRRIACLPVVALDGDMCETSQYGAVLMARLGTVSHDPPRPADMPAEFYERAAQAARSGNLYAGVTLLSAPDGFMNDSDASNLSALGHRRWQLNPAMGKVGFGYAEADTRYLYYVTELCVDMSGASDPARADYDFIAWPASGFFPNNQRMFSYDSAWSVTLNPARFKKPDQSKVTVTLTRAQDGRTWTLAGTQYSDPGGYALQETSAYFHVNQMGYGVSNCIIFRPDGISRYEGYAGVYEVRIDGLETLAGEDASLTYQVDFFAA